MNIFKRTASIAILLTIICACIFLYIKSNKNESYKHITNENFAEEMFLVYFDTEDIYNSLELYTSYIGNNYNTLTRKSEDNIDIIFFDKLDIKHNISVIFSDDTTQLIYQQNNDIVKIEKLNDDSFIASFDKKNILQLNEYLLEIIGFNHYDNIEVNLFGQQDITAFLINYYIENENIDRKMVYEFYHDTIYFEQFINDESEQISIVKLTNTTKEMIEETIGLLKTIQNYTINDKNTATDDFNLLIQNLNSYF